MAEIERAATQTEAARLEAALERIAAARRGAPVAVSAQAVVRLDAVIAELRHTLAEQE